MSEPKADGGAAVPCISLLGSDGLPWPQTFDGQTWAKEFILHVQERPEIATDEGTMIGWFANAIMVGYDRAKQEPNRFNNRIRFRPPRLGTGKASDGRPSEAMRQAIVRKAVACWLVDHMAGDDKELLIDNTQLALYHDAELKITGIWDAEKEEGGYRVSLTFPNKKDETKPEPQ